MNKNTTIERITKAGGDQHGVFGTRCRWVGVLSSQNFNKYQILKWVVYKGLTVFSISTSILIDGVF